MSQNCDIKLVQSYAGRSNSIAPDYDDRGITLRCNPSDVDSASESLRSAKLSRPIVVNRSTGLSS